jgi:hypothetical protein
MPWSFAVHEMIEAAEATPKYEAEELITLMNIRLGGAVAKMSFRGTASACWIGCASSCL